MTRARSLNVLKMYHVLETHLEAHPEHKGRFPNLFGEVKTILARGCAGPLEGPVASAQYFHGR
jgi:hypothetical protein